MNEKPPPELHNEVLHVADDGLLDHALVDVAHVAHPDLLDVDEVEEVFVLERLDGSQGLLGTGQRLRKVVGKRALMVVVVVADGSPEPLETHVLPRARLNVVKPLLNIFH